MCWANTHTLNLMAASPVAESEPFKVSLQAFGTKGGILTSVGIAHSPYGLQLSRFAAFSRSALIEAIGERFAQRRQAEIRNCIALDRRTKTLEKSAERSRVAFAPRSNNLCRELLGTKQHRGKSIRACVTAKKPASRVIAEKRLVGLYGWNPGRQTPSRGSEH